MDFFFHESFFKVDYQAGYKLQYTYIKSSSSKENANLSQLPTKNLQQLKNNKNVKIK